MKFTLILLALLGTSFALPAAQKATRSLQDDINDYLALLPIDDIKALYHKYENDAEIQKVIAYLKSENFKKVVHIVANNADVQDIVNYIEDEGVPIKELLNRLADRLGLPHWPGTFLKSYGNNRSLREFLDELKALLPINDLISLTLDKLANSESFQNLFSKIASIDGQKLHDDALSHPEIVDLIDRLNDLGVDTKKVWEALQSIFGWGRFYHTKSYASRSLKEDLMDYVNLLPIEELIAVHEKYKTDPEAIEARLHFIEYIKSKDFAAIYDIVSHNDQIQGLVDYLQSEGLRVKEVINKLADLIGVPHWPSIRVMRNSNYNTKSLQGMLDEIKALIPVDAIISLTLDKLANSESFQNLFTYISSMDGNKLHDDALSHPEIQDLINRLNSHGIDTKKIWEMLKSIFGW